MFFLNVQLTTENAFDVLCVADMYLLPGLKSLCGKTLAKTICEDNVLYMWKTAKLFRLSRLEDHCTEFMARIIERVSVCVSVLTVEGRGAVFWLEQEQECLGKSQLAAEVYCICTIVGVCSLGSVSKVY